MLWRWLASWAVLLPLGCRDYLHVHRVEQDMMSGVSVLSDEGYVYGPIIPQEHVQVSLGMVL